MSNASNIMRGKKYFLEGNLPASIKAFTSALEDDPVSPDILLGRGAAYLKLGQFDRAVDDLSGVLDHRGDLERAVFLRGIAHLNAGQFELALADLNQALEYNRERGAAILARGLAHSNMGHYTEARNDLGNPYIRDNIIIDEFIEEYAISDELFRQATELFSEDTGQWRLLLTADEMARMESTH